MKWVTDTATIYFDVENNNTIPKTTAYAQLPSQRVTKEAVINRNGEFTFTDGFNNKQITLDITQAYEEIGARRINLRSLAPELIKQGKLYLDYENDIYWAGKVISQANIKLDKGLDILTVTFDVQPLAYSALEEDLTWEEAEVNWAVADFDWGATSLTETFASGTHTVVNRGNFISQPKYIINGAGELTINGETFSVSEACIVDVENKIVYNDSVNKMSALTGDFVSLNVGNNTLVTDVQVKIVNKDRWL